MVNPLKALARQAKKARMPNKQLDHITKVTFETEDGRSFTFFNARVWKVWIPGMQEKSMTYQVRGGATDGQYPDLEEVLPKDPEPKKE